MTWTNRQIHLVLDQYYYYHNDMASKSSLASHNTYTKLQINNESENIDVIQSGLKGVGCSSVKNNETYEAVMHKNSLSLVGVVCVLSKWADKKISCPILTNLQTQFAPSV